MAACVSRCRLLFFRRLSALTWPTLLLLQALVLKVGMDSIMASYFALFEVINHSFGEHRYSRLMHAPVWNKKFGICSPATRTCVTKHTCLAGHFIAQTQKKVNHPTGKFNCSPGLCVSVRFPPSGRVVPVHLVSFRTSLITPPPRSFALLPYYMLQCGSWPPTSFPTSSTCRTTHRQCRGPAWRCASGCSASRRRSC